jgi:precorrin-4/cobalt-precorrin-4 C11-methyltransferase
MKGKVIFIGAGPGDPELLTIKGKNTLQKSDIIIYAGSLVNKEVLDYAPHNAKIYNSATMNLPEIIEIMEKQLHGCIPEIHQYMEPSVNRLKF